MVGVARWRAHSWLRLAQCRERTCRRRSGVVRRLYDVYRSCSCCARKFPWPMALALWRASRGSLWRTLWRTTGSWFCLRRRSDILGRRRFWWRLSAATSLNIIILVIYTFRVRKRRIWLCKCNRLLGFMCLVFLLLMMLLGLLKGRYLSRRNVGWRTRKLDLGRAKRPLHGRTGSLQRSWCMMRS